MSDNSAVAAYFDKHTPARTALRVHQLRLLVDQIEEDVTRSVLEKEQELALLSSRYFLFDHGNVITGSDVALAHSMRVEVIPSVNVFHYADDELDHVAAAARDIVALRSAGVMKFQIDSVYETICRSPIALDEQATKDHIVGSRM